MLLTETDGGVILSDVENFDPFVSAECGQCFRFEKVSDDEYVITAMRRALDIKRVEGGYFFVGVNEKEFEDKWVGYFDLDRDYGGIINGFSSDAHLFAAARAGSGIRIFRQDPFETLISFIISQNNNIPRIKKIIAALCRTLGAEISEGVYDFPDAEAIAAAGTDGLTPIRAGFRAKYIIDAAEKTVNGEIDPYALCDMDYEDALAALKTIKGVGDKVANCVLLFGCGFYNAFPVDVWVKKVIGKYYGDGFDPKAFGANAGIAQQYLFNYERNLI